MIIILSFVELMIRYQSISMEYSMRQNKNGYLSISGLSNVLFKKAKLIVFNILMEEKEGLVIKFCLSV